LTCLMLLIILMTAMLQILFVKQVNDNDFDDVLIVETDCIDFGSRALHHKDVPVSDHHNAYNSAMPRAKELVSLSDLQIGLLRQLPLPPYSNNYLVNNF
jgi:hypothetical protein